MKKLKMKEVQSMNKNLFMLIYTLKLENMPTTMRKMWRQLS